MARKLCNLVQWLPSGADGMLVSASIKPAFFSGLASKPVAEPSGPIVATTGTQAKSSTDRRPKKGPNSAYHLFMKEAGPAIMAKHPDVSIGERSKILAEAWKQTPAAEKARLEEQIQGAKPIKRKDSEYNFFQRHAGPGIVAARPDLVTLADRARAIAAEWRNLSEQDRQKNRQAFSGRV